MGICDGSSTKLIKRGRYWLADRIEGRTGEAGLDVHRDGGGPEDPAPELVDLLSTAGPPRQSVPAAFYPHGPYSRVSLSGETRTQFSPVFLPAALLEHMEWKMGTSPKENTPEGMETMGDSHTDCSTVLFGSGNCPVECYSFTQ